MWRRITIGLAFALPLVAQTRPDSTTKDLIRRATTETMMAFNERLGLSRFEEPLLLARLVEAWGKQGHRELSRWEQMAIAGLAKRPTDRPEEDRQRLVAAGYIYRIFAPVDRDAASKVLDMMLSGLDELGDQTTVTDPEREEFDAVGLALAEAAARVAKDDPAKCNALAHTIMALHQGGALASLIAALQKNQPDLANSILADAVESAGATEDARFTAGLLRELFLPKNAATVTEQQRSRVLQVADIVLAQAPANETERRDRCKLAAAAAQVTRKLKVDPLPHASEAADACATLETSWTEASAPPTAELKSADDFLKAALTAVNARDRAWYRMRAAQLFMATAPATGISTAASIPTEEREVYPAWRKDILALAVGVAEKFHRAGNTTGVDQVLAATPERLRPEVAVRLATWALDQPDQQTFAAKMLVMAYKSIDRKQFDDAEMLIDLVNGYARLNPTDERVAPVLPAALRTDRVLHDVAEWLNDVPHPASLWRDPASAHAAIVANGGKALSEIPPLGDPLRPAKFDSAILKVSQFDEDIRPVRDAADRASLRVGLIQRCLEAADRLRSQ